jgi:hypothetical protein
MKKFLGSFVDNVRLRTVLALSSGLALAALPPLSAQTVSGTGTSGDLPLWTGAHSIGNSVILQKSGNLGIGDTNPIAKLSVIGTDSNYATITGATVNGIGILGNHSGATGTNPGVRGTTNSTDVNAAGILGIIFSSNPGTTGAGVRGVNLGTGTSGIGVFGSHAGAGDGVRGRTLSGYGVKGEQSSGTTGAGVYGISTATDGNGILAEANDGTEAFAIWGKSTHGEAGHFTGKVVVNGDLDVLGTLSKDMGTFKIDHPLDPANKYLSHSFVESPDMMNVYNGNIVLNRNGEAVVQLPSYFQALNTDFRYQLTAIGAPGPDLFIAEEIYNNQFKIAGGRPGMKVSWHVTGIRQDPYANAHRVQVETVKPAKEIGSFLHPELYGQPRERSVEYARYPKIMEREKADAEAAARPVSPD